MSFSDATAPLLPGPLACQPWWCRASPTTSPRCFMRSCSPSHPSQEGPDPPCAGASAERRHDRKLQRKLLRLDSRWFYFDPCPVNSCGLLGGCCRRCLGHCHSSSRGHVGRPGRFDTAIGIRTVPAALQRLNPLRSASAMTVTSGFSAICAVLKPRSQQRESNPG